MYDKRWEKFSLWEWNAITMKFNFFTYEKNASEYVSETLVACCSERKKNNNNEGSVKNNHKLYIFRKTTYCNAARSQPKPLLRQKVVFNLNCLSNPKAMRFIRQFLYSYYSSAHCNFHWRTYDFITSHNNV